MEKTWPDLEKIFQDAGISYEQKEWFYLCQIKGRYFYYSPQTGKWRVKGKRAWKKSRSPQDFLRSAFKYSPPQKEPQSNSSEGNTNTNSSQKQTKKNKQKTYTDSSKQQERKTSTVDEIRTEFLERFGHYLCQQRQRKYKIGWIWYKLLEEFVPTPREICWLSVIFRYSPYWAIRQIRDLYLKANSKQICAIIEVNQNKWLNDFEKRWGWNSQEREDNKQQYNREQYKRKERTHQSKQANEYSFVYRMYQAHFEILKISFPLTKQELKTAYRKRALETHPDSGGTAEQFREVYAAYELLSRYIRV